MDRLTSLKELNIFMDHFPGNVVLADGNGKILYVNKHLIKIWRNDSVNLVGSHSSVFRTTGWVNGQTGAEAVMETKNRSIKYFKTKYGEGLISVSLPVLKNNDLEYIVTFSFEEEVVFDYTKKIEAEKNNMQQLIYYLNRNNETIIAENEEMRKILTLINKLKSIDSTILVSGESGTGKEVIAKYIHETSSRSASPFVPINCAAIPIELMEAEFFGYVKGAFTGANKQGKAGLFQLAQNGTLFLDEIGEMPLSIQAKFLRVLESGEVRRIGSDEYTYIDTRIIVATNKDLFELVKIGLFREDLYYRLNILPINVPPLRERPEDITALALSFIERFNKKYHFHKKISLGALNILKSYSWPGNVRELKNIVERLVITTSSDIIDAKNITFLNITGLQNQSTNTVKKSQSDDVINNHMTADNTLPLKDVLNNCEKQYITSALSLANGNIIKAAESIDISPSGLYKKIRDYKINIHNLSSENSH